MAVTTEKSTQVANLVATPPVNNPAYDANGDVKLMYFSFTQGAAAGDIGSTADLLTLPPGKYRILLDQGNVTCSAFGASRTLNVGYTAYTNADGTTVTADPDAFISAADVSAAASVATSEALAAGADRTYLVDAKSAFTMQAVVAGGTIPAAATLKGYILVAGA